MEGKYTKASAVVGVVALAITVWQLMPGSKKNYSGEWSMFSEVEQAQMTKYVGMKFEWVLHLTQSGDDLKGTAEKMAENGNKIDYKARTSLSVQGTLDGDEFTMNFIENGNRRETSGIFTGKFSGKEFTGTFSSTASDSKGKINGRKLSN